MFSYEPQKDFMIVTLIDPVSPSGIVLARKDKSYVGDKDSEVFRVEKIGSTDLKLGFSVGDLVVIVGYLTHIKHEGTKLTLAKVQDVILVIKGESDEIQAGEV